MFNVLNDITYGTDGAGALYGMQEIK